MAELDRKFGRQVFGRDAVGYDRSRPGYPDDLYRAIRHRLTQDATAIGEIGPGTGLATARLLELGPQRYVVFEPDQALCRFLAERFPTIEIVPTDFMSAAADGPFDLIAAAASFHWLDPDAALARVRALLRPGGQLALWWNVYLGPPGFGPLSDLVQPLLASLPMPPSIGALGHYSLDEDMQLAQLAAAGFTDTAHHRFVTEQTASAERVRGLLASFSFVHQMPGPARATLLDRIGTQLAADFADAIPLRVVSASYLGTAP